MPVESGAIIYAGELCSRLSPLVRGTCGDVVLPSRPRDASRATSIVESHPDDGNDGGGSCTLPSGVVVPSRASRRETPPAVMLRGGPAGISLLGWARATVARSC